MTDIRWKQRFNSFVRAFQEFDEAVELARSRELSKLEMQGLIQAFEYTHELAWKVLKDYLQHKGMTDLIGSKDATRQAFANDLIKEGDIWMDMIETRNLTTHTYDKTVAEQMSEKIISQYHTQFEQLHKTLQHRYDLND